MPTVKLYTLPTGELMMNRLKSVASSPEWVNWLYPRFIKRANIEMTPAGVLNLISVEISRYIHSPHNTRFSSEDLYPFIIDWVEAFIDDKEFVDAVKNLYAVGEKNRGSL